MIEAVATVPHPPLLVPRLAGAAADETAELRDACRAAAARLAAVTSRWVAVGADPRPGSWGPGTRGTFSGFGADVTVALGPRPDPGTPPDPDLPLPLLVAGHLRDGLADAAGTVAMTGVVLAPDATPRECRRCGQELAAASRPPTALLVLADGAATHTPRAPGAFDPRAAAYDDAVAAALATADTGALGALDPALSDALGVGGRVAWQILAGAAEGTRWLPDLLHGSRPYGVAYHVATWARAPRRPAPTRPAPPAGPAPRGAVRSALPRPVALLGPTATGKSDLALALARRVDVEVVNADAMQLYRGMDIGTAKVPLERRAGVPHHLLDVLDVTETATVAAYQRDARAAVDAIRARGRTPVVVGGSGLYLGALLDDLRFPGTDPAVRARLEAELAAAGPGALHARLAAVDPAAAATVLASHGRRIVRALEVVEITGRPFSASLPRHGRPRHDTLLVGLDLDTAVLDARIAARVDAMLAAGLVDEVRTLDAVGLRRGATASRAVGYREVLALLDGAVDLAEARRRIVAATRRLVRRQRSWFRRDRRVHWLDAAAPDLCDRVLALRS